MAVFVTSATTCDVLLHLIADGRLRVCVCVRACVLCARACVRVGCRWTEVHLQSQSCQN